MRKKTKMIGMLSFLAAIFLCMVVSCSSENGSSTKGPSGQTKTDSTHTAAANCIKGKVVQTMNSGGYTYLLLDSNGSKLWVAIPESNISLGSEVSLAPGIEMNNFTSNTLKRTFDKIIFSSGLASKAAPAQDAPVVNNTPQHTALEKKDEKIEKASGPNSYTIAEIYAAKGSLDGKPAVVKGKVMKVLTGIMGKTWIHLQDGSGTQKDNNFDLAVTSQDQPATGDVVIAKGMLHTDKDFGAGYKYNVIMEDAKVQKD